MIDEVIDFLNTTVRPGAVVAINVVIYLVRVLPTAGRWKLVKLALTILFLPFVLVWKFTTAGSDCGCCCDEDD